MNSNLKILAKLAGLSTNLISHVARHSFATTRRQIRQRSFARQHIRAGGGQRTDNSEDQHGQKCKVDSRAIAFIGRSSAFENMNKFTAA